jgi:hypothetical protein
MNTSRYNELVSLFMDGDPSEAELNELSGLLKENEDRARDFRDQLTIWEAWSQEIAPERSAASFLDGIHTRLRAEEDAPAFELSITKKLKQRRLPLPFHPIIAVAATAALILIFTQVMLHSSKGTNTEATIADSTHICVSGECVCTHCTLNQTGEHMRAIRYRGEGGKTKVVLLKNIPEMNMSMHHFCKGPTAVLIEGHIDESNGLPMLTATAFRTFATAENKKDT